MSDYTAESVTSWPYMQIMQGLTVKKVLGSWEEIKQLEPLGGKIQD